MAISLPILSLLPQAPPELPSSASQVTAALRRALGERPLSWEDARALMLAPAASMPDLLGTAGLVRDRGHGKTITFSAKVFLPLTTLCRDYCGYCTFRRDPGEPGARTMEPQEVLDICRAGASLGVKEALFSLGDRPEAIFPEHRAWLKERGHRTTHEYLLERCHDVFEHTPLLPHANPGLMGSRELALLREVNASVGLMLETVSERLLGPGFAHDRAPDKVPVRRLRTIERAGALKIPFTSGILIGIGETLDERVLSLLALRDLHERYGHIQEIIVQNFRVKPTIPMRHVEEPSFLDLQKTVAVARLLFGPRMNVQAPPNLSPETYPELIRAGLNDWGGVSPLTIDHINPEAPWPLLLSLRQATSSMGYELRERLSVYPAYILEHEGFVAPRVREKIKTFAGSDGLVRKEEERWRQW